MGSAFGSSSIMCMRSSLRTSSSPCFGTYFSAIVRGQTCAREMGASAIGSGIRGFSLCPNDTCHLGTSGRSQRQRAGVATTCGAHLSLPREGAPLESLVLPHVAISLARDTLSACKSCRSVGGLTPTKCLAAWARPGVPAVFRTCSLSLSSFFSFCFSMKASSLSCCASPMPLRIGPAPLLLLLLLRGQLQPLSSSLNLLN
jgi:hypothetical protein